MNSYKNGVRVFEIDVHTTDDGSVVLYHDYDSWIEATGKAKGQLSYEKFIKSKLFDKYKTIDVDSLCRLMHDYSDIYVIVDYGGPLNKYESMMWYSSIAYKGAKYGVLDRFVIEVVDAQTLKSAKNVYEWNSYVFTYYNEFFEKEEDAIAFCLQNNIKAVNLTYHTFDVQGCENWIMKGLKVLVFTVNDEEKAERCFNSGCSAVYTDNTSLNNIKED